MDNTIEQNVVANRPPEEIFEYLTEAAKLKTWFPSDAETDPVVGGSYHFTFADHDRQGKFSTVEPGRKLEYDWDFGVGKTKVGFALTAQDDGTQVEVVHTGFGSDPEGQHWLAMHDKGWESFLINLKSVIEDGRDRRAELFG